MTRDLNTAFSDDFNRYELGPDWDVIHYDGTGSVTLNGSSVIVDSAKSGDFAGTSDSGSMIYKLLPAGWVAVEVDVTNLTDNLSYVRMLMVRAGIETNAPFYTIFPDNDSSHLTTFWRDGYGSMGGYAGDNTGVTWDRTKPLRLRIERSGTTLTAKLSHDSGVTWQTIGSRTMPEMRYVCLCASYHGAGRVAYDNFAIVGSTANGITRTQSGFRLEHPVSGVYVSPPLTLHSLRAVAGPTISYDAHFEVHETTQYDWQQGTLDGVVATSAGDVELAGEFSDDFDRSTLGPDWEIAPDTQGSVQLQNGELVLTGGSSRRMWVRTTRTFEAHLIVFRARRDSADAGSDVGLAFNWDGNLRTSEAGEPLNGYRLYWRVWENPSTLTIARYNNGVRTDLTSIRFPPDNNEHEFEILIEDGTIRVFVDGVQMLQASDSTYTSGYIGLTAREGGNRRGLYNWIAVNREPLGSRVSPILDLSPVGVAAGSSISWNATTPAGTSVTVETRLSLDGGQTWGPWQQATNGGPIPGIDSGMDLSNVRFQVRQTLSTTDPLLTPKLRDLSIEIQPLYPPASAVVEIDVSTDGGTTWSGWQQVSSGSTIPGLESISNLDSVRLRYRLTLSSSDALSPVISDIRIDNIVSWFDASYDDASWQSAHDNGAYGISPWTNQVSGWPDPQARWIWDRASTSSAPVGDVYFRKKFTLSEPKWVTVAFTCDDRAELYVDGQYLLGKQGWNSTFANTIYLSAGNHVVAIKGTNTTGYAGLLVLVRDAFPGILGRGATLGARLARIFDGVKTSIALGIRQLRNLVANVYVVDIFNTGPTTRKVGDYFLGVRSAIDQEAPSSPPSGGDTQVPTRRLPFAWIPFVHDRWRPKKI